MTAAPFADLTREELVALAVNRHEAVQTLRRLYVDGNTPNVLQLADEAPEFLLTNTGGNVVDLATEFRERQRNYDTTPFDPEGRAFRLFPGGVTIWSGHPGNGKTTLIRQLICHLLYAGRGVFLASLEERPDDMLVRLMMTAGGDLEPNEDRMAWFQHAYIDTERLRMWGQIGLAKYHAISAAMRYSIREGARHCFIDSLTCLDVGGSDWDGQRGLANGLADLARASGAHIHLVAHPRKMQRGDSGSDLSDVAGSSDLVRLADNVCFVKRNLDQESDRFDRPTAMQVVVKKQRHGTGMCGPLNGWFHRTHRQFQLDEVWEGPTRYLPDRAYDV